MSCCGNQASPTTAYRANVARELAKCDTCKRSVLGPRDTVVGCRELVVFGQAWCPRKWFEAVTQLSGHCPRGKW